MKRKLFFAILFGLSIRILMAQGNITLTFTGANQNNGSYVQLQRVEIRNVSRDWTQTIIYPDTSIVLNYSTGIEEHSSGSNFLKVYSPIGKESLCVELAMAKAGKAKVEVYDLMGRSVVRTSEYLSEGVHLFDLRLQNAATYVVRSVTEHGSNSVKVFNTVPSSDCALTLSASKNIGTVATKAVTDNTFQLGDVLQIVAYAVLDGVSCTSQTILQPQSASENFTMLFNVPVSGFFYFSVSPTISVKFSTGNLQYNAATNTWRFAENAWDFVGANNCNATATYNGWIDLFGWGTSGWDCGNTYYNPYDVASGEANGLLYGPAGSNNLTGEYANADWGVYNQIGDDPAGTWRTLTKDEWNYLYYTRSNAANLCSHATVNNVYGFIFLPDNWSAPEGIVFVGNAASYLTNTYTASQWQVMEAAGAVFLPAAGRRDGNTFTGVDLGGYWSSSYSTDFPSDAFYFFFNSQQAGYYGYYRSTARSVRLVKDTSIANNPIR